jgi:hypothetical protein
MRGRTTLLEEDYPAPEDGRMAWEFLAFDRRRELTSRVAAGNFNFFQKMHAK